MFQLIRHQAVWTYPDKNIQLFDKEKPQIVQGKIQACETAQHNDECNNVSIPEVFLTAKTPRTPRIPPREAIFSFAGTPAKQRKTSLSKTRA
jgi:hypothetical protein